MDGKRVALSPKYGLGRFLVAVYNLGGKDVTIKAVAAEMGLDVRKVQECMRRLRVLGKVDAQSGRHGELAYTLTDEGEAGALHASPDIAEWRTRIEQGESVSSIVASSGHSHETVGKALSGDTVKVSLPGHRPYGKIPRDPEWARRYREQPQGIRTLAESVGVSYATMRNILRDLKEPIRRAGTKPRASNADT